MTKIEVDEVEYMEIKKQLELQQKLLNSINIKLDKLVNQRTATKIVDTLKQENLDFSEATDKKGNIVFPKLITRLETDEEKKDAVLMDLKEVTVIAHTEKAILVTKKGFQKWIPVSCLADEIDDWEDGMYFEELTPDKNGKWIMDKAWDKLEVRKR